MLSIVLLYSIPFRYTVLGVGYSSGDILLCDIEDATVLHKCALKATLACMLWTDSVTSANKPTNQISPDMGKDLGDHVCF